MQSFSPPLRALTEIYMHAGIHISVLLGQAINSVADICSTSVPPPSAILFLFYFFLDAALVHMARKAAAHSRKHKTCPICVQVQAWLECTKAHVMLGRACSSHVSAE